MTISLATNDSYRQEIEKLNHGLQRSQDEYTSLSANRDRLQAKVKSLQVNNNLLKSKHEELQARYATMTKSRDQARKEKDRVLKFFQPKFKEWNKFRSYLLEEQAKGPSHRSAVSSRETAKAALVRLHLDEVDPEMDLYMSMKPTEKENTTPPPDIATPRLPLSPRKHRGNVSPSPRRAQASPRSHRSSPRNAGTPNKSGEAEAIVDKAPPLKSLFSGVNIDKLLDDEDGEAKKDDLPSSSSANHGPTSSATEDDTQPLAWPSEGAYTPLQPARKPRTRLPSGSFSFRREPIDTDRQLEPSPNHRSPSPAELTPRPKMTSKSIKVEAQSSPLQDDISKTAVDIVVDKGKARATLPELDDQDDDYIMSDLVFGPPNPVRKLAWGHSNAASLAPSKRKRDSAEKDRRKTDFHILALKEEPDSRPSKLRRVASDEGFKTAVVRPIASSSKTKANVKDDTLDYSVYKGRGRYKKPIASTSQEGDTTINAEYMINPDRNGGVAYQYDEVVRGKEGRKQMEAGDCECCRDYYEAIGPLPTRPGPPLWKTPESSQASSPPISINRPCQKHGVIDLSMSQPVDEEPIPQKVDLSKQQKQREAAIQAHKKGISRHRHHWQRTKTPPAYWDIGFPNTQEVDEINKAAKVMEKDKRKRIAVEANKKDGKYKKR